MSKSPLTDLASVKARTSSKWRRFPADVLPMHVAEMDYDIAENIKELLLAKISASDIGYTGPVPEVAEGFVKFASERWGWVVDPKQVRLSTDVGVSAVEILRAVAKSGDKVVINSPVYSSFFDWIPEVELEVLDVPLLAGESSWSLDTQKLEEAFAAGARIYLISHPHNPMGKLFTLDELNAIATLAKKYDVLVISDEIHAPLTYADQKFIPYLSVSDDASETGVVITAASKSFNLAGLKASIIVTDSQAVQEKLKKLPAALHWRSGILGAFAMAEAFKNSGEWLDQVVELNRKSRDLLTRLIREHLPGVKYWIPESGYLAWLDVSTLNLGENPALKILTEQKVAFVPGADLGKQYDQYIRINFACHPDSLERAIKAIAAYC
ncbi:MAG: aminotransferase class I/II-fold pyridoxal phosphate-dependent enzyme [Actinobacteria bacterium]|uniref:cysteine-S-conjugate beta-lyase n=1 Tax=freshwater metagenome TaxID=449393 RepID=A0A6J6IPZ1_9ZZZZ|nr:aminotransferase class I/II-fold pyridoxal phosphate-dependent enzyme [Actinomycetota bacterium]